MSKARDIARAGTALANVDATELGYLDGVTSSVQTQLNGKQAVVSGVDDTEIGYLNGVTSAIQTQLDAKIANALVDAKGDILTATADNTPARLAVGANNTVLTADSSTATGLKWESASAADNFQLLNAGGTALTGANTITVSGISGKNNLFIRIELASSATAGDSMRIRFNSDSTNKYGRIALALAGSAIDASSDRFDSLSYIQIGTMGSSATNYVEAFIQVQGTNSSGVKIANLNGFGTGSTSINCPGGIGTYSGTSAISSVTIYTALGGNFDNGTIYVYGA